MRWITRGEAEALIRVIPPSQAYLVDFIRLALNTGCRKQELLGLEWSRVDLKENLLLLEAAHTKTARRRSIPMNMTARTAIVNRARFRAEHCPASAYVCRPAGLEGCAAGGGKGAARSLHCQDDRALRALSARKCACSRCCLGRRVTFCSQVCETTNSTASRKRCQVFEREGEVVVERRRIELPTFALRIHYFF